MEWFIGPYEIAMIALLALTIPVQRLLTRDEPHMRVRLVELPKEIREKGYWWHIGLYLAMFLYKALIDHHNEPMKAKVGGYTHWVYELEGDWVYSVQDFFLNDILTDLMSAHYLFMYLFMIWFSPMYYILTKDEVMADKAALNYFVIYLLSVPLYLFFNVEVTSSYLPNVDALLYHDSFTIDFFILNDPMDNSIPSLHIGLPISLLILNRLHCRSLGIRISEWRHREFDLFVLINVIIYTFSIQYLGIHWIVDILPGLIIAVVCATFCHYFQPIVRARPENGWKSLIPNNRQTVFALFCTILFSSCLLVASIDGAGTNDENPNYRFGEGDVNLDTVEIHSLWDPVLVEVSNVGEVPVELMLIKLDYVIPHSSRGHIDWESIVSDSDIENKEIFIIEGGNNIELIVETTSLSDMYVILMKIHTTESSSEDVGELRITPHYVDDELIWTGMLLSWPSFIIFGIYLEGILSRSENIVSDNVSNIDS